MSTRTYCRRVWVLAALCGLLLPACTLLPKGAVDMDLGIKQRGVASWYGDEFDGWLTASGEVYDMHALTAAHRTLPFGTVVRVTNAENGRQVRVRINDRGPYANGRIIDLSYGAARQLGLVASGVAAVQLEVVGHAGPLLWDDPAAGEMRPVSSLAPLDAVGGPAGWWLAPIEARRDRGLPLLPSDFYRERRSRRVADILAAQRRLDLAFANSLS